MPRYWVVCMGRRCRPGEAIGFPYSGEHIFFSGQFRFAIDADRIRFVFFGVRFGFLAIEHVIGAEVNQLRVLLAADACENARRFGVNQKSAVALGLAKIDIRERRSVDQHVEIRRVQFLAQIVQIRQIKLGVIKAGNVEFVLIFPHERRAESPARANNHNFHQALQD